MYVYFVISKTKYESGIKIPGFRQNFQKYKKKRKKCFCGFDNQFIKLKRTLAKIEKTIKFLFCLSFSIRGTTLHVICIPEIKIFSDARTVRFYPIKIRTLLIRKAFLEP